jgi:hypothetical protein
LYGKAAFIDAEALRMAAQVSNADFFIMSLMMDSVIDRYIYFVKVLTEKRIHLGVVGLELGTAIHIGVDPVSRIGISVAVEKRLNTLGKVFFLV